MKSLESPSLKEGLYVLGSPFFLVCFVTNLIGSSCGLTVITQGRQMWEEFDAGNSQSSSKQRQTEILK
jgi:hypothetical protein